MISTCTFQPLNNEEIKRHYVLKLDDNFDKEWDYLHPSFDKWTALEIDPIVNEDGSFVQAGRFKSINSIPFIRKFSPTGEIEWTWSETYDENYTFLSRDLEKTKDGGYVMAAFQFSGWQRGWLVKIDSLGNTCSYVGCDSTVLAPPIDTSSIDSTNTFIDALSHLSPYFVRISPNPVKDQAMLLYELPSMAPYADFRLFNSQGERVLNQKILTLQNSHSLALGHLTSGVYIWEVSVLGQKIKMGKLVVNE